MQNFIFKKIGKSEKYLKIPEGGKVSKKEKYLVFYRPEIRPGP